MVFQKRARTRRLVLLLKENMNQIFFSFFLSESQNGETRTVFSFFHKFKSVSSSRGRARCRSARRLAWCRSHSRRLGRGLAVAASRRKSRRRVRTRGSRAPRARRRGSPRSPAVCRPSATRQALRRSQSRAAENRTRPSRDLCVVRRLVRKKTGESSSHTSRVLLALERRYYVRMVKALRKRRERLPNNVAYVTRFGTVNVLSCLLLENSFDEKKKTQQIGWLFSLEN